MSLDKDTVARIARLARLKVADEELAPLAGELSGILGHVDRIANLDLEGVEPTSHVVQLENVLRADEPWTSLPPQVALSSAPEVAEGAFRAPSPQADVD